MDNLFLAGLDPARCRDVLQLTVRRRYRKGDTLFHEGDPGNSLHMLVKGFVAIRTTTFKGDTATLAVLGPGDFFGEQALISVGAIRSASAVAIDPVETMALRAADFEQLRDADPRVDRLLLAALGVQVRRLSAQLAEALYLPAETRVVRRLRDLADVFGADSSETVVIPITQEDLSTMAGTTRPTTNQVLQELVAKGVVQLARGRIDVVDVTLLRRLAR